MLCWTNACGVWTKPCANSFTSALQWQLKWPSRKMQWGVFPATVVCTMKVSQLSVSLTYFCCRAGKGFAHNENIFSKLNQNTLLFQGRFGGQPHAFWNPWTRIKPLKQILQDVWFFTTKGGNGSFWALRVIFHYSLSKTKVEQIDCLKLLIQEHSNKIPPYALASLIAFSWGPDSRVLPFAELTRNSPGYWFWRVQGNYKRGPGRHSTPETSARLLGICQAEISCWRLQKQHSMPTVPTVKVLLQFTMRQILLGFYLHTCVLTCTCVCIYIYTNLNL